MAEQTAKAPTDGKEGARPDAGPYRETAEAIIRLRGVGKTYFRGDEPIPVLDHLDLDVPDGSFEALMGPSGSGKTTLLNLIAGLDRPSSGSIEVAGKRVEGLTESALAKWRADTIGFVFQSHHLLPVLTAVENVELPLLLTRVPARERRTRAQTALRIVGLEDRMNHFPRQLSGGQEQRVSIARAFVNDPAIVVADEPTGDLDRKSADEVLKLLERLNQEMKKTIVMVTHDPVAAERASVVRHLDKGKLT